MGVTGEKKVVLLKAIIILFFDRVNSGVCFVFFFSLFSGQKTTLNLPPKIVKFCSKTMVA